MAASPPCRERHVRSWRVRPALSFVDVVVIAVVVFVVVVVTLNEVPLEVRYVFGGVVYRRSPVSMVERAPPNRAAVGL